VLSKKIFLKVKTLAEPPRSPPPIGSAKKVQPGPTPGPPPPFKLGKFSRVNVQQMS